MLCCNGRNNIKICVRSIAKAGTGFILDICEPIVRTIFCENNNAPNPIKSDVKKYNFLSFKITSKFKISNLRLKNGEYIPTIAAVKCAPKAKAAIHPKNIKDKRI